MQPEKILWGKRGGLFWQGEVEYLQLTSILTLHVMEIRVNYQHLLVDSFIIIIFSFLFLIFLGLESIS